MITEALLNEFSYSLKQAELLVQELKEARSLLTFALDAKRIETTNRALLYFVMSDSTARNDIKKVAQTLKDKDVLKLLGEFEETF